MASANAVSIVRELGIRGSGQPRSLAFLGPGDHAAPYPSGCAKTGHHKTNRLAYFSSHLFDAASIYRCRAEDHQELLRHSTIRVTLDTYTQAVTTEKRNAQEAVVALLFRGKTQET